MVNSPHIVGLCALTFALKKHETPGIYINVLIDENVLQDHIGNNDNHETC